ncbi:putative CMP deaminase [Dickeya phage vB_DsoM_JA33]|uniref:CMP deaminase n=3 Tax=Salmondvirus JA11 TaxID=2734141 RepID=A0A384ZW19_9CAUD|nr:putative CMP deaminase [Dickeya phage vB_DsoM_JA11]AXG66426.1 CMP deaminase [Dickeya phage vB_DsoM_JA13]AXG67396.1 putative CMP deaminase [Dickeya phage vB_DsoM_JA33]AYD79827.1 putative CMP deaminase [Dickeya phage vB_DsoM_JA11]
MESINLPIKDRVQHYPFLAAAFSLANISKARRRACGAVLVREINGIPTIVGSGVNGTEPKEENLCETHDLTLSFPGTVHAEINCVSPFRESAKDTDILYITDSPCEFCLEFLKTTSIRTVVFARCYRITEHMEKAEGFRFIHIPEQAVIDYMNSSISRMSQVIS